MQGLIRRIRGEAGVSLAIVTLAMFALMVIASGMAISVSSNVRSAAAAEAKDTARDTAVSLGELGYYTVTFTDVHDPAIGGCYWWASDGTQPDGTTGCTELGAFTTSHSTDAINAHLFRRYDVDTNSWQPDGSTGSVIIRYEDAHTANPDIGANAEPADSTVYARMVITSKSTTPTRDGESSESSEQVSWYNVTFGD